jgi:hypothetical protein
MAVDGTTGHASIAGGMALAATEPAAALADSYLVLRFAPPAVLIVRESNDLHYRTFACRVPGQAYEVS